MLGWAWNEISNLMLTTEIEMILADFCQTTLCRSNRNSGRLMFTGGAAVLYSGITESLPITCCYRGKSILSSVSHCIISVIFLKFQSQFRLLAHLQVASVTLPVGEALKPQALPRRLSIWLEAGRHDSQTPVTLQMVNLCEALSPTATGS